jgi:hypothetical protein
MAMRLHTSGGYKSTARVDDLRTVADNIRADGDYLSVIADKNASILNIRARHGLYVSVFDQKHLFYRLLFLNSVSFIVVSAKQVHSLAKLIYVYKVADKEE